MYYIYVLLCQDGSLYTGTSNNPQQRFLDKKKGKGGKYPRAQKPIKILYTEELLNKSAALKREIDIKSWSREKKIRILKLVV